MISLLIVAGVSLTGDAISWYNRKRLKKIQAEIDRLNAKLEKIKREDLEQRKVITEEYINDLITFSKKELQFRDGLYLELNAAMESLNNSSKIGAKDSPRVIKIKSDLYKG